MLNQYGGQKVYLAIGITDLRKSIDGLAAIVQFEFQLNPFNTCLFVFCNRKRDKIKILEWEHSGFWLHYKRLEKGRFHWPKNGESHEEIRPRELRWILDGLPLQQKKAHPEMRAKNCM